MPTMRTPIHESANGDRWFLCRGEAATDVFVFHEPNGPSGGATSRIEISAFLARDTGSPQVTALLAMIGSLVAMETLATPPSPAPEPGAAGAEPTPGEAATNA